MTSGHDDTIDQDDFVPDVGNLLILSIRGAISQIYSDLTALASSKPGSFNGQLYHKTTSLYTDTKKYLYYSAFDGKNRSRDKKDTNIRLNQVGIIHPNIEYRILKDAEKNLTRYHHEYYFNKLAKIGYMQLTRAFDNTLDTPEQYNQWSNFAGGILRYYALIFLPVPLPVSPRTGRQVYPVMYGQISPDHAIVELELVEVIRPNLRKLISQLVQFNLREFELSKILSEYLYLTMMRPMTSMYAGLTSSNKRLPLNGRTYTRRFLQEYALQAIERAKVAKRVSMRTTTVTKELNKLEFGSSFVGTRWGWVIRDQVRAFAGGVDNLSQKIADLEIAEFLSDNYLRQCGSDRSKRAKTMGNLLDGILPQIMGLSHGVYLRNLLQDPVRYGTVIGDFVIATEVKFYYGDVFGRMDIVVLRNLDLERGSTPIVFMILDRKSITYEKFSFYGKLKLRRYQKKWRGGRSEKERKKNTRKLQKLYYRRPTNQTVLTLFSKQFACPTELFNRVMHQSLDPRVKKERRYRRQLDIYAKSAMHISHEVYNNEFTQKLPLQAILLSDSFHNDSDDLKELGRQELSLIIASVTKLLEINLDDIFFNNSQPIEISSSLLDRVRLVLAPRQSYYSKRYENIFHHDTLKISTYKIYPFKHNQGHHDLQVTLYYHVRGPHRSTRHVALIHSVVHIFTLISDFLKDDQNVLCLDVSGWLGEFAKQRLLGFVDDKTEVWEFIEQQVNLVSYYYPDRQFVEITQEYDVIVLLGLNLLREFIDEVIVDIYRREIIELLGKHTSKLYLLEKPVYDAQFSSGHQIKSLLPYPTTDSLEAEYYQQCLTSIIWNLPVTPIDPLVNPPKLDHRRIIFETTKKTRQRIYIGVGAIPRDAFADHERWYSFDMSRFVNESHRFDRFPPIPDIDPDSVDMDKEFKQSEQLFRWRNREIYRDPLLQVQIDINIRSEHSRYTMRDVFEFDPSLPTDNLPSRVELEPGRFRGARSKDPPTVKRSLHNVSHKTPYWSYFFIDEGHKKNLLEVMSPDSQVYQRDIKYLKAVIALLRDPTDLISDRRERRKFLNKNQFLVEMMEQLSSTIGGDLQDQTTRIYNTLAQLGLGYHQWIIKFLYRSIPKRLDRFLSAQIGLEKKSHSDLVSRLYTFPLLSWIILMLLAIWNYYEELEYWQISSIFYQLEPWAAVQLDLPVRENSPLIRVPARKFRIRVDRIFKEALGFARAERKSIKQLWLARSSKYEYNKIRPVQICQTSTTVMLTIQEDLEYKQYFIKSKSYKGLQTGQSYSFEYNFWGLRDMWQADHMVTAAALVTLYNIDYLLVKQDLIWICLGAITIHRFGKLDLSFTNFSPLPFDQLPVAQLQEDDIPHDHGTIEQHIPDVIVQLFGDFSNGSQPEQDDYYQVLLFHDQLSETKYRFDFTENLFKFLRNEKDERWYDDQRLIKLNRVRFVVPEELHHLVEMEEHKLEVELQNLKNYIYQRDETIYPETVDEFISYLHTEIKDRFDPVIGHNQDRDAIITREQIELVRDGGDDELYAHQGCFYIELDVKRETTQEFISVISDHYNIQLYPGKNYLWTWQIQEILEKQYLFAEIDGNLVKYEIDPEWELDRDEIEVLQEDSSMYWLSRSRSIMPRDRKRTKYGSYEAAGRYLFRGVDIEKSTLITSWQLKGSNEIFHLFVPAEDDCKLVEIFKEAMWQMDAYPIHIDEEKVIDWKSSHEEISKFIDNFVEEHFSRSGRRCRRKIHERDLN